MREYVIVARVWEEDSVEWDLCEGVLIQGVPTTIPPNSGVCFLLLCVFWGVV